MRDFTPLWTKLTRLHFLGGRFPFPHSQDARTDAKCVKRRGFAP